MKVAPRFGPTLKLEPLVSFRIYCKGPGSHWFTVYVWRNLRQLRANAGDGHSNTTAFCRCYTRLWCPKRGPEVRTKDIGELHFPRSALRMEIIVHECTHAAIGWARRNGINPMDDGGAVGGNIPVRCGEERFAWALDNLVRQVVLHTQKLY